MSDNQNFSIWTIFKNQFNKVFKELLGFEGELGFNNIPHRISDIKVRCDSVLILIILSALFRLFFEEL